MKLTEYEHIVGAQRRLGQLGLQNIDMPDWLERQGLDPEGLEKASQESATDTFEEIETFMDETESPIGKDELLVWFAVAYRAAFLTGWMCRERVARAEADAAK